MDRSVLLDHLLLAERHVAAAEDHIRRHQKIIAELEQRGHDTKEARNLLASMERMLEMHIAERDRIRKTLE